MFLARSCAQLCHRPAPARAQVPLRQQHSGSLLWRSPAAAARPAGAAREPQRRRSGPGRAEPHTCSRQRPAPAALRSAPSGASLPWIPAPLRAAASELPRQHCGGALPSHDKPPLRRLTADMQHYRPAFHLPRAAAGAAAASLSKWQLASPLRRRDYSLICPFLLRPPTGFLFIARYSAA